MPSYKWHLGVGIVAYLAVLFLTDYNPFLFFAISVIYSLFPDIDISTSKLGRWARLLLLVGVIVGMVISQIWISLTLGLALLSLFFVKHRGFFHTFRAAIFFSLPLLLLGLPAFVYGVGLYILHLVLDGHIKF